MGHFSPRNFPVKPDSNSELFSQTWKSWTRKVWKFHNSNLLKCATSINAKPYAKIFEHFTILSTLIAQNLSNQKTQLEPKECSKTCWTWKSLKMCIPVKPKLKAIWTQTSHHYTMPLFISKVVLLKRIVSGRKRRTIYTFGNFDKQTSYNVAVE